MSCMASLRLQHEGPIMQPMCVMAFGVCTVQAEYPEIPILISCFADCRKRQT